MAIVRPQFDIVREVACCIGSDPITVSELCELTGLPDEKVCDALQTLSDQSQITIQIKSSFDERFRMNLDRYWKNTRSGIEADVRWRFCILSNCRKGFWSRHSSQRRCPQCSYIHQSDRTTQMHDRVAKVHLPRSGVAV